jgi:putative DNA primase/helicase
VADKIYYRPRRWRAIQDQIAKRAGYRCEGSPDYPDCRVTPGERYPTGEPVRRLIIVHLDLDRENWDTANLRLWCRRCYKRYTSDISQPWHETPWRRPATRNPTASNGTGGSMSFERFLAAIGAKPAGEQQWMAHCPAHDDRTPSLSIARGDRQPVLLHCFADCEFADIVDRLASRGLWPVDVAVNVDQTEHPARDDDPGLPPGLLEFDAKLVRPENRVVERYLRERLVEVADLQDILQHPKAFHAPSGTWWPAMVAAVRDVDGHLRSLHRTFLSHIAPPAKAPIEPVRMLWKGVPARVCAIHLAPAAPSMLVGEGIETTASAMKLLGLPGWAAISASNLPHVVLPDLVREVVIAADADPAGLRAAVRTAQRLRREGRAVRIVKPGHCNDFNDLLQRHIVTRWNAKTTN